MYYKFFFFIFTSLYYLIQHTSIRIFYFLFSFNCIPYIIWQAEGTQLKKLHPTQSSIQPPRQRNERVMIRLPFPLRKSFLLARFYPFIYWWKYVVFNHLIQINRIFLLLKNYRRDTFTYIKIKAKVLERMNYHY